MASTALDFLLSLSPPPPFAAENAFAAPAISTPATFRAAAAPMRAPPAMPTAAIAAPPPRVPTPPFPVPPTIEPTIPGTLLVRTSRIITQSKTTIKSKKMKLLIPVIISSMNFFPIPTKIIIVSICSPRLSNCLK